jgi:hypothetical protein
MERHIQSFGRYIHAFCEAIFSLRRPKLNFENCGKRRKSHKHRHSRMGL